MIYFTIHVHRKSIKVLRMHYHELMRKIAEYKGKKYLMVNDYMLNKVLDKIKETICIVKFHDTRIWNVTDDKLLGYIALKMS